MSKSKYSALLALLHHAYSSATNDALFTIAPAEPIVKYKITRYQLSKSSIQRQKKAKSLTLLAETDVT